jgi:hypothetical protein
MWDLGAGRSVANWNVVAWPLVGCPGLEKCLVAVAVAVAVTFSSKPEAAQFIQRREACNSR